MRNWIIAFAVIVRANGLSAQVEKYLAYNRLISQAERAAHLGLYDRAFTKYDSAFVLIPWGGAAYFDPAVAALRAGQPDRAIHYLLAGAEQGLDPREWNDSLLRAFLQSRGGELYLRERPRRDSLYRTTIDTAFVAELHRISDMDQAVRQKDVELAVMVHQDSLHFERMLAICAERGFPSRSDLGNNGGYWWSLLWHHRGGAEYPHSRQWQQMLPYIRSAIDRGDISPAYLCMFDDYVDQEAGRPMRYGALLGYYASVPEMIFLVDRAQLDRNRASVGWGPISWFAEELEMDLSTIRFAAP